MILKCINTGTNKSITEGFEYELINENETRYSLINDKGVQKNYSKTLFEEVNQLVEVQAIDIDGNVEFEIIHNDEYEEDIIQVIVTTKLTLFDGDDNRIAQHSYENNVLEVLRSDNRLSCGIKNLVNISEFMATMDVFFNSLETRFAEQGVLVKQNSINDLIDNDCKTQLYTELMHAILQLFNNTDKDDTIFGGILQASTNLNNGNNDILFIDVLDKLADSTLDAVNHNSANEIRLWNFKI
jgi:hypothetical protein